jgi:hypothetical protein
VRLALGQGAPALDTSTPPAGLAALRAGQDGLCPSRPEAEGDHEEIPKHDARLIEFGTLGERLRPLLKIAVTPGRILAVGTMHRPEWWEEVG